MRRSCLPLLLLITVIISSGCSMPKLTQQQKFDAYSSALVKTAEVAVPNLQDDPAFVADAIKRLQHYYRQVTVDNVMKKTRDVYAENAFLCDTLHIANGADEIERYFVKTAERVNSMQVDIIDYSFSDMEIYARWTMTISSDELADGKAITTFGTSHFRLNASGKVVLHQDFWDASAGFFELLPGIGGAIQRIRGRL